MSHRLGIKLHSKTIQIVSLIESIILGHLFIPERVWMITFMLLYTWEFERTTNYVIFEASYISCA